jgi:hypothetical protein
MIDVMGKLKTNFVLVMRQFVRRGIWSRTDREATSPPGTAPRHPLLGALKGLLRVMQGTDLTKPADPDWGKWGLFRSTGSFRTPRFHRRSPPTT